MADPQHLSIVLRIPNVAVTRPDLEVALGTTLDRFHASQHYPGSYAQLNWEDGPDIWVRVAALIDRLGPRIVALVADRAIGPPSIDVAVAFSEAAPTVSLVIPSVAAEVLGRHGVAIEVSVYATSAE